MGETKKQDDQKVETQDPSFSSTEDEPLATAGTGGSEDPKGKVRPGGGEVAAETPDSDEERKRQEKLSRDGTGF